MNTTNQSRTYVCKRLRLCRHLIDRGFKPYRIVPDMNNPKYNVYLFTQTPELYETVEKYFENIRRSST